MANFAIANSTLGGFGSSQAGMTATYKTICLVAASTTGQSNGGGMLRRGKVYDILVGTNGTPADNALEFAIQRATVGTTATNGANATAAGALTSASSAYSLDPADLYLGGYAMVNSSNEAGITLISQPNVWYVGINQRASYRWVAAPGSEILYPAVSSGTGTNGLVLQARNGAGGVGYTANVTGTVYLSEQ